MSTITATETEMRRFDALAVGDILANIQGRPLWRITAIEPVRARFGDIEVHTERIDTGATEEPMLGYLDSETRVVIGGAA